MKQIITIDLPPRLDNSNSDEFARGVVRLVENGAGNLVLDLDRLIYMTSGGVRAFLLIAKAVQKAGGNLLLACCHSEVMGIFKICGLERIGMFTTSLEGAKSVLRRQTEGDSNQPSA